MSHYALASRTLLFVSHERAGILGAIIEGAPDLVAEILSTGNTRSTMEEKLADYGRLGVRECWLVSPEASSVEVLEFHDGSWQRLEIYGLGDTTRSSILKGSELRVGALFCQVQWLTCDIT